MSEWNIDIDRPIEQAVGDYRDQLDTWLSGWCTAAALGLLVFGGWWLLLALGYAWVAVSLWRHAKRVTIREVPRVPGERP